MSLFLRRSCGIFLLFLALAISRQPSPAFASLLQEPEPTPTPPSIYIVQPGDTLFDIAQRYGISVDLLVAANGIQDETLIAVGQSLVIPPPPAEPAVMVEHTILPGETLRTVSKQYQVPELDLVKDNYMLRDDDLPAGGVVLVDQQLKARTLTGQTRSVCPGETLMSIAVQTNSTPWLLAEANQLEKPYNVPPYYRLWIPAEQGTYADLPAPLSGITLNPLQPEQGQTFSIHISTTMPVSISALLSEPLNLYQQNGLVSLEGINAMEPTGLHELLITAPFECYNGTEFILPINIQTMGAISETIAVPDDIRSEMTEEVVMQEQETIDQIFETVSPDRSWDSYFSLPASADVSSSFGNRRTYNVPQSSPYHTGTDLGTPAGTAVYAPANGVVVYTGTLTVRGNVIVVDHGWGVMSGFWHLEQSLVNVGDRVEKGQQIGISGNTGLSTAAHLHWELRINGTPVDGMQWIREIFP